MEDDAPPAPPPALMTRRDCTILGAKVFAMTMVASLTVPAVIMAMVETCAADGFPAERVFARALMICVPPAVALGAIAGFELYRFAVGSREWRTVGCGTWILLLILTFIFFGPLVPMLYVQYRRREMCLIEGAQPGWIVPTLYVMANIVQSIALFGPISPDTRAFVIIIMFNSAIASLFISDCILVNFIARWRREGRLAPPTSHTFQFTLGTLLIFVLGLGAWMTALVSIFK